MKAAKILEQSISTMIQRGSDRDVEEERSMGKIVSCFNTATGHSLSERDGWIFLVMLKAVRACATEKGKLDDYVDGGAYFALAGESVTRD